MRVPARFHSAPADSPRRSLPTACVPLVCPTEDGAFPHSAPRQGISRLRKEKVMSKTCGDTARFHRIRKQKINRRAKNRILQAEIAARKAEKAAKPAA
jgi:hypothetical protein